MKKPTLFVVWCICAAWFSKLAATPAGWSAFKRQIHAPTLVGTMPLDRFIDVAFNFVVFSAVTGWLIVHAMRFARRAASADANSSLPIASAMLIGDSTTKSYRSRPKNLEAKRAEVDEAFDTITAALPRAVRAEVEGQRAEITERLVENWRCHGQRRDVSSLQRVVEQLQVHVPAFNERSATITTKFDVFIYDDTLRRLVESVSGTYVPFDSPETRCCGIWAEPMTSYQHWRLRLFVNAAPLMLCTQAGAKADALHDSLMAECRLASYQGYIVAGSSSPEVIERETIREVQSIIRSDLLASTPDLEVVA